MWRARTWAIGILGTVLGIATTNVAAEALTFVVDSTADTLDLVAGDGTRDSGGSAHTLRAAIQETNTMARGDVVDLTGIVEPASPIVLSIDGVDETWSANPTPGTSAEEPCIVDDPHDEAIGYLETAESLTITGAGYALTVIAWPESSRYDGDPATGDRIFNVVPMDSNISVGITGLTAPNGSVGLVSSEPPRTSTTSRPTQTRRSRDPGALGSPFPSASAHPCCSSTTRSTAVAVAGARSRAARAMPARRGARSRMPPGPTFGANGEAKR